MMVWDVLTIFINSDTWKCKHSLLSSNVHSDVLICDIVLNELDIEVLVIKCKLIELIATCLSEATPHSLHFYDNDLLETFLNDFFEMNVLVIVN